MTFDIAFTISYGILCAAMGGVLGMLFVAPFEHKGTGALVRQTLIATFVAAFIIIIPSLIFGFDIFTDQRTWSPAVAFLGGSSSGIILSALISALTAPARVRKFLAIVPLVAPFATRNFTALDVDDDKVLSEGDLGHALKQTAFGTAEDQEVLEFMRYNMSDIGHGVGSYTTYNGKTASSRSVSVISPCDLEAYTEKAFEKFAAWRQ